MTRRPIWNGSSPPAAHRSAFGVTLEMLTNPPPDAAQVLQTFRPVLEREVFLLGGARGPVRGWPLPDLFDGLKTAKLHPTLTTTPAAGKSLARN